MIENQAKEELIERKAKPELGGKTYRKSSQVRLGEPMISMKTPKDSSWVRLGVGNSRLGVGNSHRGVEVRLGVASLRLG